MFGDDKDPAPRKDAEKPAKQSSNQAVPKKDRPTSEGDFDFHDWASI